MNKLLWAPQQWKESYNINVLSFSPYAGFLESDRLSTTQVENTGITNRIQIFLTWKRKKKTCMSPNNLSIFTEMMFT